ncbi:MAG: hypothetical protein GF388_11500 [Candidatus Aegiribacteria sp.]|nr:hypothetical protein [Candidatus Aegiribacteria sp.]MBD3295615.1 hypothetical protein [Candidatus Fermentibacteria bacterium]
MKPVAIPAIVFYSVILAGCGGENSRSDMSEVPDLQLVKLDSIGEETGDSNYILGNPAVVEFTSGGRVVCSTLDTDEYCIVCFETDGEMAWEVSPDYEKTAKSQAEMDGASQAESGVTTCTLEVHRDLPLLEVALHWIGPPEVPRGFRLCHTLSASPLGSDTAVAFQGLDARYHSDVDAASYLVCQDMNFDGIGDLRLMNFPTAGPNTYWYFWLTDSASGLPEEAQGWENDLLVSPEFDQENRLIRCFHRDGMGMYGSETYRIEHDVPVLIRTQETEYSENGSAVTVVTELIDGEMTVIDTLVESAE